MYLFERIQKLESFVYTSMSCSLPCVLNLGFQLDAAKFGWREA